MRGGGKGFIIIGVFLALAAVALVVVALVGGNQDATSEPPVAEGTYLQAAIDVPAHTILSPADVTEVSVPVEQIPSGAVTNVGAITGMAYETALTVDKALLSSQLEQPGLSNDVADGMRAISIPVDEESVLHGLIANDDHVDVVFKARIDLLPLIPGTVAEVSYREPFEQGGVPDQQVQSPQEDLPELPAPGDVDSRVAIHDDIDPDGQLQPTSKLILQDIRVIRVVQAGQSFSSDGQPVDSVVPEGASQSEVTPQSALVLEVTPQQGEALAFMRDAKHSYQIMVRGRDDHEQVSTSGITFEILIEDDEYALPVPGGVTVPEPAMATPAAKSGSAPGSSGAEAAGSPVAAASTPAGS